MRRIGFILLCAVMLSGCGTAQKTVFTGTPNSDAEAAYRDAVKTLESGSYEDSVKAFHALKLKYPYATRWATLSDLRIADAYREAGDYAQAAVTYQNFIRTYPAHAEVPYASYQAANCYYKLMPSDLFILPDPWQRDRKSTQQAETALGKFLRRYPNDPNAAQAKEQYEETRRRLANHELYVAEYNFKHEAYQGTVNRLVTLIADYPEAEVVPKAHILLAHAYLKLRDPISAKRTLSELIEKHSDAPEAADAQAWVARNPEVP